MDALHPQSILLPVSGRLEGDSDHARIGFAALGCLLEEHALRNRREESRILRSGHRGRFRRQGTGRPWVSMWLRGHFRLHKDGAVRHGGQRSLLRRGRWIRQRGNFLRIPWLHRTRLRPPPSLGFDRFHGLQIMGDFIDQDFGLSPFPVDLAFSHDNRVDLQPVHYALPKAAEDHQLNRPLNVLQGDETHFAAVASAVGPDMGYLPRHANLLAMLGVGKLSAEMGDDPGKGIQMRGQGMIGDVDAQQFLLPAQQPPLWNIGIECGQFEALLHPS